MKILLTNDDGIDAQGITALKECLQRSHQVVIVAPDEERSECGHSVTTRRPLRVIERETNEFSVDGTPADCVRLGLSELAKDAALVISGINHGGNLGGEIWVSGTVAAAREGRMRGVHAVAVSQYRRPDIQLDWSRAARQAEAAIMQTRQWFGPNPSLWNINLPAVEKDLIPDIQRCNADSLALPLEYQSLEDGYHYRSSYHDRPRTPGADTDVCFGGRISITLLE